MSDIIIVALITVSGGLLTLFVQRWFSKMDKKLDKYHDEVNGKIAKLLETTKALGNKEGRAQLRKEQEKDKSK